MASVRSTVRSSQTQADDKLEAGLRGIELRTQNTKITVKDEDGKEVEPELYEHIPVDILSGDYSNDQINVLAQQIAFLQPKEYAKFYRFVFVKLDKYFSTVVYVTNRISQLNAGESIEKSVSRKNEAGRTVRVPIKLSRKDITHIKGCYSTALLRAKNLLRSSRKTVRVAAENALIGNNAPMFGNAIVKGLLANFQDEIFGTPKEIHKLIPEFKENEDFLATYLPHAAEGEFIKGTLSKIFHMITYHVKIAAFSQVELPFDASAVSSKLSLATEKELDQFLEQVTVAQTGFPDDIVQYLSGQRALFVHGANKSKDVNKGNTTLLESLQQGRQLNPREGKEAVDFSFDSFEASDITTIFHDVAVGKLPDRKTFGDLFTREEYARAEEFFGTLSKGREAEEDYQQLLEALIGESEALFVLAEDLSDRLEAVKGPVTAFKSAIKREKEKRKEAEARVVASKRK